MVRLLLLVAVAAALVLPTAAQAAAWLPTETLSEGKEPRSARPLVTAAGEVLVGYESDDTVVVVRRTAAGASETLLDEPGYDLQIAADDSGRVLAAWDAAGAGLRMSERPAGGAFAEPQPVGPAGAHWIWADMSGDGSAAITWSESGTPSTMRAVVREGHGAFGAPVDIAAEAQDLRVAMGDGGQALFAWGTSSGPGGYRVRRPGGQLGATKELEPDIEFASGREITIAMNDAGDAQVAWFASGVGAAHLHRGDDTLSEPAYFDPPAPGSNSVGWEMPQPAIGADGDGALLWMRNPNTEGAHLEAALRTGDTYGDHFDVVPQAAGRTFDTPMLTATSDGILRLAWHQEEGSTAILRTGVLGAGGATQIEDHEIETELNDAGLAVDASGNAALVWGEGADEPYRLRLAGLDAGPAVRIEGPRQAVAGEATSFRATVSSVWGAPGPVAWAFGDGATATGGQVAHAYAAAGPVTVTATTTDAHGVAGAATLDLRVDGRPASGGVTPTPAGPAATPPVPRSLPAPPAGAPAALHLRGLKVDGRGRTATAGYTLSAAASVTLRIERASTGRRSKGTCAKRTRSTGRAAACTRWTRAAAPMTVPGRAGANRATLPRLAPGSYRVIATVGGRQLAVAPFRVPAAKRPRARASGGSR